MINHSKFLFLVLFIVFLVSGCVTSNNQIDSGVILLLSHRIEKIERKEKIDLVPIYKEINNLKKEIKNLKKIKVQESVVENKNINIIWIKMKNKSMIPVKIEHNGDQWIGPKGEVYDHLPTERELKLLYRQ